MHRFRRISRWLAGPLGLLLGVTLIAAWAHTHPGPASHDACATCSLSHAPSIAPVLFTFGAPSLRFEPVVLPTVDAPGGTRIQAASSRAPPLA